MADELDIVTFVDRNSSELTIKVLGKTEIYKNIKFFDFTSDRKMMTRIVKNLETGEVFAYTKGADSAMLPLCEKQCNESGHPDFYKEEKVVIKSIDKFANKGFRTLVFAMREISEEAVREVLT